jgi:hypothetical protein
MPITYLQRKVSIDYNSDLNEYLTTNTNSFLQNITINNRSNVNNDPGLVKIFLYGSRLYEDKEETLVFKNCKFKKVHLRKILSKDLVVSIQKVGNKYMWWRNIDFLDVVINENYLVPPILIETKIKLNKKDKDYTLKHYEILRYVDAIINAVRLIKPARIVAGRITNNHSVSISEAFLAYRQYTLFNRNDINNGEICYPVKTILGKKSIKVLGLLIRRYSEVLKKYSREYTKYLEKQPYWEKILKLDKKIGVKPIPIALDRYKSALLESVYPERQITNAVMVLETVYLGRAEDASKNLLAARIAKIWGSNAKINKLIIDAYNIRNDFVHASGCDKNEKELAVIAYDMLELARLSIIILLELEIKKLGKNELVEFLKLPINKRHTIKQKKIKTLMKYVLNNFNTKPSKIGTVIAYYSRPKAADIRLVKNMRMGDKILVINRQNKFEQTVSSMRGRKNKPITYAKKRTTIGLGMANPVHIGDKIYAIDY